MSKIFPIDSYRCISGSTSAPCISILVIAHHESILVHRTLKSVYAAVADAEQHDIACEVIVVLDRGDEPTRRCVSDFPDRRHQVLEVDVGDLALAREAGRAIAKGKYISLIDGDDLYGQEWLRRAYTYAESQTQQKIILHAQHQIFFDADSFSVRYQPSVGEDSRGFEKLCLVSANHWTSILFFSREVYASRPFTFISRDRQNPHNFGYGFEDWHWIAEQVADDSQVLIVPETCNFVRRKRRNSMLQAYAQAKSLLPPTALLHPPTVAKQIRELIGQHHNSPTQPVVHEHPVHHRRSLGTRLKKIERSFRKRFPKARLALKGFKGSLDKLGARLPQVHGHLETADSFLEQACRNIHHIDTKIFPSQGFLRKHYDVGSAPKFFAGKYRQLCAAVQNSPTHVFLVPWLKRGGSDLETLNYIHALCDASSTNQPLVIGTVAAESPWVKQLPDRVPFINFGSIFFDAAYEDQKNMLATFLVQLGSPVIHNVNSQLGYHVFHENAHALKNQSRLYASIFCEDITPEGRTVGYAFDELIECIDDLAGVFTDNQRIINYLIELFGIPEQKFHLHYQPIESQPVAARREADELRVLWAGRIDRQKRIDVLYRIVERLENTGIRFSIYGESVLDAQSPKLDWSRFSHVRCCGAYDGFASLPHNEFDVFLHTAQWEGLPNVLLESLSRGLPIVASGVGGVPELTQCNSTGIAVTPFDNVDEYCTRLLELREDRKKLNNLAHAGWQLVRQRHSWQAFHQTLGTIPDYCHPRQASRAKAAA